MLRRCTTMKISLTIQINDTTKNQQSNQHGSSWFYEHIQIAIISYIYNAMHTTQIPRSLIYINSKILCSTGNNQFSSHALSATSSKETG